MSALETLGGSKKRAAFNTWGLRAEERAHATALLQRAGAGLTSKLLWGFNAWVSSTELSCIAPEHAVGTVAVELTQNEQQYTADGVSFEYELAVAHSIYPNTGPTLGGTLVEVRGANIEVPDVRGLYCQFGSSEPVSATHASRPASSALSRAPASPIAPTSANVSDESAYTR